MLKRSIPTIGEVMTTTPLTIEENANFQLAQEIMQERRIRHLPVTREGQLVGILSDRDIKLATGFASALKHEFKVGTICTPNPLTVGPETSLAEVGQVMLDRKIGCVLVTDSEKRLLGIFTEFDAIRIFMKLACT